MRSHGNGLLACVIISSLVAKSGRSRDSTLSKYHRLSLLVFIFYRIQIFSIIVIILLDVMTIASLMAHICA